jgi:hypothetical protein
VAAKPHVHKIDGAEFAMGQVPEWHPRNQSFLAPAPAYTPSRPRVSHRIWVPVQDQLKVGACVSFAGHQTLASDALHRLGSYSPSTDFPGIAFTTYAELTARDEFAGTWRYDPKAGTPGHPPADSPGSGDDTGTSLLAFCQWALERGHISRYEWITGSVDLLLAYLGGAGTDRGRVIFTGWAWTRSMCQPDSQGRIKVTGRPIGGHATVLRGYDREYGLIKGRNQWGKGWGAKGDFLMTHDDVQSRMDEGGEQVVLYR